MSAKKKRYPARVGWIGWNDGNRFHWKNRENGHQTRVRVTDARDLTAEQAVEKVLRVIKSECWAKCGEPASAIKQSEFDAGIDRLAKSAGMSARVVNGKVRVRMEKQ